jgi:hypothetical protein
VLPLHSRHHSELRRVLKHMVETNVPAPAQFINLFRARKASKQLHRLSSVNGGKSSARTLPCNTITGGWPGSSRTLLPLLARPDSSNRLCNTSQSHLNYRPGGRSRNSREPSPPFGRGTRRGSKKVTPGTAPLLSKIFVRLSYSVEPFDFRFFKSSPLPPLSDGRPDNVGN